jgi:hypothetical protein
VSARTFSFRFGFFRWLLSVLGMGPRFSRIELTDDTLVVRMGWAFRATLSRSAITGVRASSGPVGGIGVHGWRGRWLVNGAASGLVTLTIDPPGRAYMVFPVQVRQLTMSLEDPDAFIEALGPR